jgi:hypothetical protein
MVKLQYKCSLGRYLYQRWIPLNSVLEKGRIAAQQSAPIAANVREFEMLANERGTARRNLAHLWVVMAGKLQQVLQVGLAGIAGHWDIVDPGTQSWIEELFPFVAHMKHWANREAQSFPSTFLKSHNNCKHFSNVYFKKYNLLLFS